MVRVLSYIRYSLDKLARVRALVNDIDQKLADDLDIAILKLNRVYDKLLDLDGQDH